MHLPLRIGLCLLTCLFAVSCNKSSPHVAANKPARLNLPAIPSASGAKMNGDEPPPAPREFRAVWVATVGNIDWPSKPGLSSDEQKAEIIKILDRAQEIHLNAIVLQV